MTTASPRRRERRTHARSLSARLPNPPSTDPQASTFTLQVLHLVRTNPAPDEWKMAGLVQVCARSLRMIASHDPLRAAEAFAAAVKSEIERQEAEVATPKPVVP